MKVDDEVMPVLHGFMTVRVTVGLRTFPAFMLVPVVLVVDVEVLMFQFLMNVLQLHFNFRWPYPNGGHCRGDNKPGQAGKRNWQARYRAEPAGEGIRHQPARMGQCELRRK